MSTIDVGCLSMGALGAVLRPGSWDMRSLGGQSRDRSAPLAPAGPQPGRGGPPHRPVDGGQCDIGHRGTVQQQERKDEFIRSEQVGEKCRGPGGTVAFDWLQSLSGLAALFTWGSICFSHIRFRNAWKYHGHTVDEIPFTAIFGVTGSWIGLGLVIIVLIAQVSRCRDNLP